MKKIYMAGKYKHNRWSRLQHSIAGLFISGYCFAQFPGDFARAVPLPLNSNLVSQGSNDFTGDPADDVFQTDGSTQATGFSDDERPGRQTSGDSRGYCVAAESPVLTGVVPSSNLGTTVDPNPTLWFFVPDTPEAAVKGYFTLQDQDRNNVIDEIEFRFPNRPGYIGISLPSDFSLVIDSEYRWTFEMQCSPSEPPIYVQGWIKRIALDSELERQLDVSVIEHYRIYTDNYIWFDAIDNLITQRLADPDNPDLIEAWNDLLNQGGGSLSGLPEQPILGDIDSLP